MRINDREIAALTGEIVRRMTIELEASGRHVHLCRRDVETLFGPGYQLTPVKELSQPGQYACAERVTLAGPKGELHRVVVLGPERPESQVEISLTDAVTLGVVPPVRLSGEIEDTPGLRICFRHREVTLQRGLIAAKRHIHITPQDARRFALNDGQQVRLRTVTARPVIFEDVSVRISPKFSTRAHLDYDEANACGFRPGDVGMILP